MIDWAPLLEIIAKHARFVLSSHVRPDADALGSELGMARILRSLGKQVRIINPSATPAHLQFLDPEQEITKLGAAVSKDSARDTDVHLVLDTSAWVQLGDVAEVLKTTEAVKAIIDHHVSSDDLGASEFKDTTAAATGELVVSLAEALNVELTEPMATPLFCAIATDTGWFRFSSTDRRTFETVAKLVAAGTEPTTLYRELYERSSLGRLKLHGIALSRVNVECDGKLAHTYVLRRDFKETRSHPSDTEDLVNDCLTLEGAHCAYILVEQQNSKFKVSLRSRTDVDVSQIAEELGGGGHRQASGAMIDGSLEAAQQRLNGMFARHLGVDSATASQ